MARTSATDWPAGPSLPSMHHSAIYQPLLACQCALQVATLRRPSIWFQNRSRHVFQDKMLEGLRSSSNARHGNDHNMPSSKQEPPSAAGATAAVLQDWHQVYMTSHADATTAVGMPAEAPKAAGISNGGHCTSGRQQDGSLPRRQLAGLHCC